MNDNDTEKAGTTDDVLDDGNAEATGTRDDEAADGDTGGDDAEARLTRLEQDLQKERSARQQLLAQKTNWEQGQRELDDLRRRVHQGPPPQGTPENAAALQELDEAMLELRILAHNGDKQARLQLASLQRQYETEQKLQRQLFMQGQMARIPEADHDEVMRYLQTGEYGTPAAAHKAVKADRFEAEKDTLAKDREQVNAQRDAQQRRVVRTDTRGVPASEAKDRVKPDDFVKQWDAARAKGDTATINKLMQRWKSNDVR